MGFSNSGFDTAFFEHSANHPSNSNSKYLPADIKVDDEDLQSILKETVRNTKMVITVELGTINGNVFGARLIKIHPETA